MHFRRAFPDFLPVVVSTPNPAGGRSMNPGRVRTLRTRPPVGDWMNGLRLRSATKLMTHPDPRRGS